MTAAVIFVVVLAVVIGAVGFYVSPKDGPGPG